MNFNYKLYVIILTLSIIFIIYSYNVSNINAQINGTQTLTVQLYQDEFQPPIDINTLTTNSTMASPTFNPPLKKCETHGTSTEGEFDVAKYVITGDFNKDKLQGKDFTFEIFADLVKNDEAETKGNDAPYKANIVTDQDKNKTNVNLKEIATVCIDTQHVINLNKTAIILESDIFKSLDY